VTTVDQHVATQGRMAAELAIRLLSGEEPVSDVEVTTHLVERASTGLAPA